MADQKTTRLGEISRELALKDVAWVAEFLGVSTSWVYKAAERGELPCRRVGACLRFVRSEIEQWTQRTGSPKQRLYDVAARGG